MNKRIVYTRHDGGVSICCPSDRVIAWMGCGGRWKGMPRGFVEIQVSRQIEAGHIPDAAWRFARAMAFGGCSSSEALKIIRDRDCGHLGTGFELWDVADVPTDRWFRNAWRRSHNGGPIDVCLKKARPIQFQRIKTAVDRENRRRACDIELFDAPMTIDWTRVRNDIKRAADIRELRHVWPLN